MNNDLETLYFPNKWSKRLPPDLVVPKHLQFTAAESEKVRTSVPCDLNISYGSREKEKFDIFGTDLPKDAPILVFVHGGYWHKDYLSRDTYHFIAANLYKNKIKSIFIGYELCPKVTLAEIVEEIGCSIKKCIDLAKENNSRSLHLAGYSSGGHLVATLFTKLNKNLTFEDRKVIKSAFLIAGIYDLSEIPKTSISIPLQLDEREALKLSPQQQEVVEEVATAFYVIAAENDSPVFKTQSKEFHGKLESSGLKSELVIVEETDHFDVIELLAKEDYRLMQIILNVINSE